MRTNYCGKIDESLLGSDVELYGWVHRMRDLGGIIFIDLRDREGLVQAVIDPQNIDLAKLAKSLHNETVIRILGKVSLRPQDLINPNLKSGKIEITVTRLDILNRAAALPFPINEPQETSEDLRLRYRYLDIRRPEIIHNLILRADIVQAIHAFLNKHDFIEVETPILTKSTPEGARDYLVPSRVHRGQFYALPQSPQIFKQLLMVAGIDRYYQIARCFRDEDLRADRQPEFTQLDAEMSFVTANEIQDLMENLLRDIFAKVLGVNLPNPLPRLTYQEAIAKYGSDKPDLRIPLELVEINDLVKNCGFNIFADAANTEKGRVVAMRVPDGNKISRKQLDGYVEFARGLGLKALPSLKVNDLAQGIAGLQSSLLKFFTEDMAQTILQRIGAKNGDMIFFAAGEEKIVGEAMGVLRIKIGKDSNLFEEKAWCPLWVVDFPLFEKTAAGWTSMHHPFTAPYDTDPKKLEKNPGAAVAQAYDLVLNGTELGGGSIRISDSELQMAVFRILSIDEQMAQSQFGHLLDAFKYGYPPHGGVAFGLDRIAMLMAQAASIRDVIAFPKTLQAACPLTQAPSEVSAKQLQELNIKIMEDN